MRLFAISEQGHLTEYKERRFSKEHMEETLEAWLEVNPGCVLEDSDLLLIGRQVTTNLNSVMDLLALDRQGNTVVVEFKRGRVPRDVIAQALEYASFAATLSYEQLQKIFQTYAQAYRCFATPPIAC